MPGSSERPVSPQPSHPSPQRVEKYLRFLGIGRKKLINPHPDALRSKAEVMRSYFMLNLAEAAIVLMEKHIFFFLSPPLWGLRYHSLETGERGGACRGRGVRVGEEEPGAGTHPVLPRGPAWLGYGVTHSSHKHTSTRRPSASAFSWRPTFLRPTGWGRRSLLPAANPYFDPDGAPGNSAQSLHSVPGHHSVPVGPPPPHRPQQSRTLERGGPGRGGGSRDHTRRRHPAPGAPDPQPSQQPRCL